MEACLKDYLASTSKLKPPVILPAKRVYLAIAEELQFGTNYGKPQASLKKQREVQLLLGFRENWGGCFEQKFTGEAFGACHWLQAMVSTLQGQRGIFLCLKSWR